LGKQQIVLPLAARHCIHYNEEISQVGVDIKPVLKKIYVHSNPKGQVLRHACMGGVRVRE
jgi:hypothetical protein